MSRLHKPERTFNLALNRETERMAEVLSVVARLQSWRLSNTALPREREPGRAGTPVILEIRMPLVWRRQLRSRVRQDVEPLGPRPSPTQRSAFWRKQLQGIARPPILPRPSHPCSRVRKDVGPHGPRQTATQRSAFWRKQLRCGVRQGLHLSMDIKAQFEYFFAHHFMVCVGCSSLGSSGRDFAPHPGPADRLREKQSARLMRPTHHALVNQTWPASRLLAQSAPQP